MHDTAGHAATTPDVGHAVTKGATESAVTENAAVNDETEVLAHYGHLSLPMAPQSAVVLAVETTGFRLLPSL